MEDAEHGKTAMNSERVKIQYPQATKNRLKKHEFRMDSVWVGLERQSHR